MSVSAHGHGVADSSASASPLSPHFAHGPSPPPGSAAGGVRRHQSLNYPTATPGVRRLASGLKRAGTLQVGAKGSQVPYSGAQSPSPTNADEEYDDEAARVADEESYFAAQNQQQASNYPGSPIGRSSPWSTPGGEWRAQMGGNGGSYNTGNNSGIDDVSRALSALEINQQYGTVQGQSAHPPRFNPSHPPPVQVPGVRSGNGNGSRKLQLVTDLNGRDGQAVQSASAYVPPIGHPSQGGQQAAEQQQGQPPHQRDRAFTASGTPWEQKERLAGRTSNPSLASLYQQGKMEGSGQNVPSVPSIPPQYLNQGQAPRLGVSGSAGNVANQGGPTQGGSPGQGNQAGGAENFLSSPIDVPTLIATKGYNPVDFDTRPAFVSIFFDSCRALRGLSFAAGTVLCYQVVHGG